MNEPSAITAPRKIIHIDMDAFFAAVEQRDFPEYRGKPIIVGGAPDSRGVVATCSYEARPFGIHSAMPSAHAHKLCPQAIFVRPRFTAYREASEIIRSIFAEFTEFFEPLSLDEAYLDVSDCDIFQGSATLIAKAIKRRIYAETGLIASAGVSYNKFLAKIASDLDKPDGLHLITPDQGPEFVGRLPVGRFHGIGKATEAKMHALGIFTGLDLRQFSKQDLQEHFGKAGLHYYNICRAIDFRPVNHQRTSKSIGVETTFSTDIFNSEEILQQLWTLFDKALTKVTAKNLQAFTVTLKVKYHDFELITRSTTVSTPVVRVEKDFEIVHKLIQKTEIGSRKVRLLGITLSSLETKSKQPLHEQLDIFKTFAAE